MLRCIEKRKEEKKEGPLLPAAPKASDQFLSELSLGIVSLSLYAFPLDIDKREGNRWWMAVERGTPVDVLRSVRNGLQNRFRHVVNNSFSFVFLSLLALFFYVCR
jgi:hypothetical protein